MTRGRRSSRRTTRSRAGHARPCTRVRAALCLLLVLAALVAGLAPVLAACGGDDEPFAGLWWEPATGRRVEIRLENGDYWLYYGAAKRPHLAERSGDELRMRDPLGEDIIVRPGDGGTLEMQIGDVVSRLKPVPQHQ